jgi:hypothetical protein
MAAVEVLLTNRILIVALVTWALAQILKAPFYYLVNRKWDFGIMVQTGGMPSSHSALMTGVTMAIGLYDGFGTPLFALAVSISMVVIYDAAGVRRQAGFHAERINVLFRELLQGYPVSQEFLKEVLGHTPRQVLGGVILGLIVPLLIWSVWP